MSMTQHTRPWWLLPPSHSHWAWWIALAPVLVWIEYSTTIYAQFPVAYVIPVGLAAWYSGRWPALALAIVVPAAHLGLTMVAGEQPAVLATLLATTAVRGALIVFIALWFARLSAHERALQREVRELKGLLTICSFCKKIRNESGAWEHLEHYISRRSDALFSHGVCRPCQETQYGNLRKAKGL